MEGVRSLRPFVVQTGMRKDWSLCRHANSFMFCDVALGRQLESLTVAHQGRALQATIHSVAVGSHACLSCNDYFPRLMPLLLH